MINQLLNLVILFCFLTLTTPVLADEAGPHPVTPVSDAKAATRTPYWEQFNDPTLNELIRRGLGNNFDVAAARHRVSQAEAMARQALAPLLPSISAEAGYNLSPYNSVGSAIKMDPIPGAPASSDDDDTQLMHSVSTVLKASYLVDITGKNVAARQAALRDAAASRADAAGIAYNLAFLIIQTYFDVITAQTRLALIEGQIKNNSALLELVEARLDRGSVGALDVLQQRQQLEATKAQLPLIRALVTTGKNQLALLIGAPGADELPPIGAELPQLSPAPAGRVNRLPSHLPSLRAEKLRMQAAEHRKKSAQRTLLPSLVLNGSVGYQMNYIDQVGDGETWALGAMISIPLWSGGANHAALRQSKAALAAAKNGFAQKQLTAVKEVDNARIREQEQQEHYEAMVRQLEASKVAFGEARERYVVGLTDYLNVLVTLATHQAVQLSEAQAYHDLVLARVRLLQAMGGDWTHTLLTRNGTGE